MISRIVEDAHVILCRKMAHQIALPRIDHRSCRLEFHESPCKPESLTGLRGRGETESQVLEDRPRALDQLAVGGEDTAAQVEVILQADADIAAEERRLRH